MIIDLISTFFKQYGLTILPIFISLTGVLYSNYFSRRSAKSSLRIAEEANRRAVEANELSQKAINKIENQFIEINRPQLTAEPVLYQNNHGYFELKKISDTTIMATTWIAIRNNGNVIANHTILEEAIFQIRYRSSLITMVTNYYDFLGKAYKSRDEVQKTNFTMFCIQPNSGLINRLEFLINLEGCSFNSDDIVNIQDRLSITLNLRLVCTYSLISGKQFISDISYGMTKQNITIIEARLGVYDAANT